MRTKTVSATEVDHPSSDYTGRKKDSQKRAQSSELKVANIRRLSYPSIIFHSVLIVLAGPVSLSINWDKTAYFTYLVADAFRQPLGTFHIGSDQPNFVLADPASLCLMSLSRDSPLSLHRDRLGVSGS